MKLVKRIIVFIMAIIIPMNSLIVLADGRNVAKSEKESAYYNENDVARNAFESLDGPSKELFLQDLKYDIELQKYHQSLFGKKYYSTNRSAGINGNSRNAYLKKISTRLAALALPIAVMYTMKAFSSSLVVATMDGPLPVGDIMSIATGAGLLSVLVIYWNDVEPKWNQIVSIYKSVLVKSSSSISAAFSKLKVKIKNKHKDKYNKSAKKAVDNLNSNKQNHILNNKKHNHGWKNIFNNKTPKWKQVAPLLIKTLQQGIEKCENKNLHVYIRKLSFGRYTVVVRYIKNAAGEVQSIGTAWVE